MTSPEPHLTSDVPMIECVRECLRVFAYQMFDHSLHDRVAALCCIGALDSQPRLSTFSADCESVCDEHSRQRTWRGLQHVFQSEYRAGDTCVWLAPSSWGYQSCVWLVSEGLNAERQVEQYLVHANEGALGRTDFRVERHYTFPHLTLLPQAGELN